MTGWSHWGVEALAWAAIELRALFTFAGVEQAIQHGGMVTVFAAL